MILRGVAVLVAWTAGIAAIAVAIPLNSLAFLLSVGWTGVCFWLAYQLDD